MPALNIPFTEAELALLRASAKEAGRPVTKLGHDDMLACAVQRRHRAEVDAAIEKVVGRNKGILDALA